jgi:Rrf2 family protein
MALISRRASYGLRTMYRLAEAAREGHGATIATLAAKEHLPRKYLEQVLRDLKQARIIESKPGPKGGCKLARAADTITVGEVVRALDGPIEPGHCLEEDARDYEGDCPGCWGIMTCSMREVWLELQEALNEVLDKTTIEDLVQRQKELSPAKVFDYQI